MRVRQLATSLGAPLVAVVFALAVTAAVLAAADRPALPALVAMVDYAAQPSTVVLIVNSAAMYYIAALAVAVGFRAGVLNIGIDGQYRLAALTAASVGAAVSLPAPLQVGLVLLSAIAAGALWALAAACLKVFRGVSEIISTIMLNFVATGIIAYLLQPGRLGELAKGSSIVGTPPVDASARVPGISIPGTSQQVYGLVVVAVLVGLAYWFVLSRTRFGFDIRAAGKSPHAAVASGVDAKRLTVIVMVASGGVAGLAGLPLLLGDAYSYGTNFPSGIAFTGIAIALLGRNHPLGVAAASLLFGFLDNASSIVELNGVPPEVVKITQGVLVLGVVICYEFARRWSDAAEQRAVRRRLEAAPPPGAPGAPSAPTSHRDDSAVEVAP